MFILWSYIGLLYRLKVIVTSTSSLQQSLRLVNPYTGEYFGFLNNDNIDSIVYRQAIKICYPTI